MIRALLVVVALALSTSARADVWRHAIDQGSPDTLQDVYDSEMKTGDENALQATSAGASAANVRSMIARAVMSYRNAAAAKPQIAEPFYKIGRLLYSFYFEPCNERQVYMQHPSPLCPRDPKSFDATHAKEIVEAWDAFEALAPLDPRVSVDRETGAAVAFNLLFHRAVLETQLAGPQNLAAAVKDYEKILARSDVPDETVLSNLAEAYMMLGRLDDAIDTYRQALRTNRNTETMYGLAVALDRDERTDQAHDVISAQGEQAMAEFHRRVAEHITFFVPEGEEAYYFALAYESFGMTDSAIEYWKKFLVSKAAVVHPQFKQRAREHLDPLLHERTRKAIHLETPWRDFHSLIALVVLSGTALAQSKRYPAPPKDVDQEAESHSHLWESALDPERKPYEELVRDARRLLDDTSHPQKDQATAALPKLDEAVAHMPKDYRAHALRGRAYLMLGQFAKCAADLELADDADLQDSTDRDTVELDLGICEGRAGKLADAERTLLHAVTVAPHGEQWMRLGEVRIALGKLDEAVDSLTAALEARDGIEATIHWLLALAYDRARKSSLADDEARLALNRDPTFTLIQNPAYPWLRPGELEYMMGIARRASANQDRDATPEIALLYFRRFLRVAGDSPWKRRAEEHVKELGALPYPLSLPRTAQSTALVDTVAYVPIVQRVMPALRACIAKLPGEAFTVTIVRSAPHETSAAKPHYTVPASSVKVAPSVELEPITQEAEDGAVRCLAPIAERIALPPPKERDTYYQVSFTVVPP